MPSLKVILSLPEGSHSDRVGHQLHDHPVGVLEINRVAAARMTTVTECDGAHLFCPVRQHALHQRMNVVNQKCDVSRAGSICRAKNTLALMRLVVGDKFEMQTVTEQMGDMALRPRNTNHLTEPGLGSG